ncbi:DNA-binding transcriptional activator of the SARP family [Kibdelosporangium aridum]|uniref:DNA-binding transcriptional activator of the SARP family n=1 Tax=Kibdelosporangium aridum TaxID=2030 RepID=A0A1W2FU26_KIBAR|nr:DNA-binding transcriptional activator of the SARP family [Kibdelosporangium aridum]
MRWCARGFEGEVTLEFKILGTLRVYTASNEVRLTARMPRLLLAILLSGANEPVSVDVLIHALWDGRAVGNAANKLHLHAHRVRRVLDDRSRLRYEHGGYLLRVHPGELDRDHFEELLDRAAANPVTALRDLRAANALWRGRPFGELGDCQALHSEIHRLTERHLAGLEDLCAAEINQGAHAAVVSELTEMARVHPFRERVHALLMTALHRSGRQTEALAVYQRVRQTLVEELGLEPGPLLRRAHAAVLASVP